MKKSKKWSAGNLKKRTWSLDICSKLLFLLNFVSQVKETGELSTCLQIKFYRQADLQHCEWGSRLHCIELDCSAADGSLSVTVSKQLQRSQSKRLHLFRFSALYIQSNSILSHFGISHFRILNLQIILYQIKLFF